MPKATTRIPTNARVKELEWALRTITGARKWIPSIVKAMSIAGAYPKADIQSVEGIDSNWHKTLIKRNIERERTLIVLKSKWAKILKKNGIYRFEGPRAEGSISPVVVARVLGFNKLSIMIQVLATEGTSVFYGLEDIGKRPAQSRIIYSGDWRWHECPFSLENVKKVTEVTIQDLVLYVGMNPTTALTSLLKEG